MSNNIEAKVVVITGASSGLWCWNLSVACGLLHLQGQAQLRDNPPQPGMRDQRATTDLVNEVIGIGDCSSA